MRNNYIFNIFIESCTACIYSLKYFASCIYSSLTSAQFYAKLTKQKNLRGLSHVIYSSFLCILFFQLLPVICNLSHIEDALKNDANKSDIQKNINSIIAKMPVMYYNKQTQSMSVSDTLYKQTIQNLNGDDAVIINLQPDEHLQQISTLYSNAYLSSLVTTSDEISHIKLLNSSQSYDVKNQKDDQSQHHALNIHFLLKVESKHIELILRDRSSEYLHFNYTYPTLLKTINGNTNQDLITFDHTMLKSIALRCTQYYMHFLMICELTLGVAAHTFITLCSFIMRCFFIYALTLIVQRRLLPFRTIMSLAIFSGAPLLFLPSGLSSICGLWTMYLVFIGLKQNKKYAW